MFSIINNKVNPIRESIKSGLSEVCEYRYYRICQQHIDTFWILVEENLMDSYDDSIEFYTLEDLRTCFEEIISDIVDGEHFCEISEDGDVMPFASLQKIADEYSDTLSIQYDQRQ